MIAPVEELKEWHELNSKALQVTESREKTLRGVFQNNLNFCQKLINSEVDRDEFYKSVAENCKDLYKLQFRSIEQQRLFENGEFAFKAFQDITTKW